VRILVVEDELKLGGLVCGALRSAGFAPDHVSRLSDARAQIAVETYDAIVLDLNLPDGDGIDLLHEVRRTKPQIAVLALTARDSVEDRVRGLDAGADDYLVKPFATAELHARLRALLRRPGAGLGLSLCLGNLTLDTVNRSIEVECTPLPLPRHELAALEVLMRRAGHVVTKERLLDQLYAADEIPPSNAVPVHIHHLRRHLALANASVEIVTFRGLGYMLTPARGQSQ
jgi:DNA-binding response OmpR family regulator